MSSYAPIFNDNDKEIEESAYEAMKYIPVMPFFVEWQMLRAIYVTFIVTAQNLIILPISLLKVKLSDPRYKHSIAIFSSMVLSFCAIYFSGLSFDSGLQLMKAQSIYKLWAVYTLCMIVGKYLARIHTFTHKIIRGAIRKNRSIFFPIIVHALSNLLYFAYFSIVNGTYIAGLYGKASLFLSACIHIQAVIAKKFLPKVVEGSPIITQTSQRLSAIIALAHHMYLGPIEEVKLMIYFELGCSLCKSLLASLTEDSPKYMKAMKGGADAVIYDFLENNSRIENSFIALAPTEIYSIIVVFLILQGPLILTFGLLGGLGFFSFVAPFFVFRPAAPPADKKDDAEKQEKKEVNEKPKDKKE